ncbi:DUF6286 domain-containing protein [Cellulomonas chengniuliangii]|uniref:DUF6286 domain-containing protein n=1 Tax=Cellulomonas chengniuliangii TaxID=2968084 RepID=A0ABY5KVV5_9CELL|nr:DUF6286 domain-containing protein [Cellulomonas chengniuliangii]MCC2310002.1 DUF6286 domain-containing protein [Cellulomonas chengniuliangii]UUI74600.1 DUF6286 domain-containing protein [Cellulomonas chengniuliangii]
MSAQHAAPAAQPLRPARAPTGSGAIGFVGPVLAVLTIALGLVLVRDALAVAGVISGDGWVVTVLDAMNGQTRTGWALAGGIVAALLGLWLIVVALRRRRRKALWLRKAAGVGIRPRDVARLARVAADDVDGVLDAKVTAGRRNVNVDVRTTGDPYTRDRVREVVTARLAALAKPPKVSVRARPSSSTSGGMT